MGSGPSQPPGYSGLNPDQINMVNQQGFYTSPNAVLPNGQQWQQPAGYSGLDPSQIEAVNQQGFYTSPDAVKPGANIWDRLMNAVGQGAPPKMPGTTIGAPAGQTPPALPPPPVFPPGQRPPGMGAYFQAMQNPPQGGNLMAQYMALQRLIQGG